MELDADIRITARHRVYFVRDLLDPADSVLVGLLRTAESDPPPRALVFVDDAVLAAWPKLWQDLSDVLRRDLPALTLGPLQSVPGGEGCKNDPAVLESALRAIHDAGLCRRSYVVAIGGGAVLDVTGFAASTAHRGVRVIRVPTTTLGQADSGIGVKNGVNLFGKKNYLGTFDVPWGVVNAEAFLGTLDDRDWRCGFSEAVKVALIKDAALFERIEHDAAAIAARDLAAARGVIERSCRLHFEHIVHGGDPFERDLARPLDFGHWAAHKLEQMTDFDLRHGEAVAMGVALDVAYSARCGLLDAGDAERVYACLERLGLPLHHPGMHVRDELLAGLEEFREHLGGRLAIPLLSGIGQSRVVDRMVAADIAAAADDLAGRDGHRRA